MEQMTTQTNIPEVEATVAPENSQWYVIHTYSGYEKKVQKNLTQRIESMGMLVNMIELREGDEASNQAWFVVRNTPGVTSFVGAENKPIPLPEEEIRTILKQSE